MRPPESRPFTREERRALKKLASPGGDAANDLFGTLFVFALVLVLEIGAVRLVAGKPSPRAEAVSAGIAAVAALAALVHIRRGGIARAQAEGCADFAADLAGGRAERQIFDVVDAVAVAEHEDEGSSFFLKLAEGEVLFLSGQYLYESVEDEEFPSSCVAVTRAPKSRIVLDLECLGTPLAVHARRPAFTRADHEADRVPEDGALLQVDFESLRRA